MRIGLSYHGGDSDYDAYPAALHRRAAALGLPLETLWLAGKGLPERPAALNELDAVVLTGGPDLEPGRYGRADAAAVCRVQPERDAVEWELLERLRERPLPMLAICRGMQILNVFYGGTLIPDLGERNAVHRRGEGERREHEVRIAAGTRLREIAGAGSAVTNSSHHQAVDRPAPGFRVSAVSADGVVEAIEPERPDEYALTIAVQWHPEGMAAGLVLADRVLDALLAGVGAGAAGPSSMKREPAR